MALSLRIQIFRKTRAAVLFLLALGWNLDTARAQPLPVALPVVRNHVDMAPLMAAPRGKAVPREPRYELREDTLALSNASLRCLFATSHGRLTLRSLYNAFTTGEMLLQPGQPALFVVEANGKRFLGSRDFALKSVSGGERGFEALLHQPELGLQVAFRAAIDTEGLRLSSRFENSGSKALDFKVAFPCIHGLRLSDKVEDDYYYFPWGGGVFSSRPTIMRLGYGDSQALWQIMDVFSPAKGGGVYLRGDDDKGFRKTMSLRKFTPGEPEQVADQYMRTNTKAEYLWRTTSLEQQEGTGLAIEYSRRTRQPGESYEPPPAVLAAHAGNWKTAMSAYADWAHKVWSWRPHPSQLKKVFHLGIGGWPDAPLFVNGKYREDFLKPNMDAVELCCWWDWSPVGPGGVPFDKLSPEKLKHFGPYLVKDPVTGETMFMGSPTDYAGYNDRFGGREAFRKAIASNKRQDKLITLYVDPFKLDEFNCETGRKFGRKWNFVDSHGRPSNNDDTLNPCYYLPEVQDWLVATMKRVLKETGADGIRLDEVGGNYGACFAPDHQHVAYEERGLSEWNKAMAETVRRTREAMDEVDPSSVLMVEHPGYDYLFAALDGCLTYDLSIMDTWGNPSHPPPESVRVLEVNLQRFYFPECKVFEINHWGRDKDHKRKFWNGVPSFRDVLPTPFHHIFRDNADVYASRDCEALVPTLAPKVYANRFTAGGKTFYHLYNATGQDYHGPVLRIVRPPGHHLFDMLAGREVPVQEDRVELSLANDDVACVAILPSQLEAQREGDLLRVSVKTEHNVGRLSVCGPDGGPLRIQDLNDGENVIDLSLLPKAGAPEPAVVKLLDSSGLLLDLVAIENTN